MRAALPPPPVPPLTPGLDPGGILLFDVAVAGPWLILEQPMRNSPAVIAMQRRKTVFILIPV